MNKWVKITLITMLVAVLAAGAAMAAAPKPQNQQRLQRAAQLKAKFVQKIGITDEQAGQIRAILMGGREESARLQKELRTVRLRLALAVEEGASAERLEPLIAAHQAAAKAAQDFLAGQVQKAFEVLTVEQRAKVLLTENGQWWKIFLMSAAKG